MIKAVGYVKEMLVAPSGEALTPAEKLVALVIADYYNAELGYAYPSMERLAAEALVGDRHCRRIVKQLEAKGVLAIRQGGGRFANRYAFPGLDGVALPPVADVEPQVSAAAEASDGKLTASEVAAGLRDVLDGLLADYPDDPTQAYMDGLVVAGQLADEFADLSKDMPKFLRNSVIAHAADRVHGDRVEGAELSRLYRAATTLGPEGARWVIWALWRTASARITGSVVSYVIKVAEGGKADWAKGGDR
jgi:hypothetical protein